MAIGPGKYDFEATMLRAKTKADGVMLIVLGGRKGHGASVQIRLRGAEDRVECVKQLVTILRELADKFEEDAASIQS